MKDYQKRVVKELRKLEKKANKLQAYINSDQYPIESGSQVDELLVSQLHAMWVYASILKRRIQLFEEDVEPQTDLPEDDLFKSIGVIEVKDGNVIEALDEAFSIIANKTK